MIRSIVFYENGGYICFDLVGGSWLRHHRNSRLTYTGVEPETGIEDADASMSGYNLGLRIIMGST